jgi:hypothetical protein
MKKSKAAGQGEPIGATRNDWGKKNRLGQREAPAAGTAGWKYPKMGKHQVFFGISA